MLPIMTDLKREDALSPLFFSFAFEYAISRDQVNQDGFKLNGIHQFLVYANDVNLLGGSVYTTTENAETLVVASKEIGLAVNAELSTSSCLEIRMSDEAIV